MDSFIDGQSPELRGLEAPTVQDAAIIYDPHAPVRGRQRILLKEIRKYSVTLQFEDRQGDATHFDVMTSFNNHRGWKLRSIGNALTGEFQVVNYVGVAWIQIADFTPVRFEIVPEKIGYENEYHSMVESIARQCQQLLLEWNTPTTHSFAADPTSEKRILLEQFLFLRHCLGTERLDT